MAARGAGRSQVELFGRRTPHPAPWGGKRRGRCRRPEKAEEGPPRGAPMPRCPCAGDRGAGAGRAACGARGRRQGVRSPPGGPPGGASGSGLPGRRRPRPRRKPARGLEGKERSPAGPWEPSALAREGGRAPAEGRPPRGSLPTRSLRPRLSVLQACLTLNTGWCKAPISLPEPLRESLSLPELQSPHPGIGGHKAPTCQVTGKIGRAKAWKMLFFNSTHHP